MTTKKTPNTTLVLVRVSPAERAKLEEYAAATGSTKAGVVHELIRRVELVPQLALAPTQLPLREVSHEAQQA